MSQYKTKENIPTGVYTAVAGGYVSEFKVGGQPYRAKFNKGVRGFNIPDIVTVTEDGIRSKVLGTDGHIQ